MRLVNLKVHDSKNLQGLELAFDENSPCTVFVGQNGSGKSNLFEALGVIFDCLEKGRIAPFKYELEYVCRGRHIRVESDPGRIRRCAHYYVYDGTEDAEKPISQTHFKNWVHSPDDSLLPDFVFGYYSGECRRFRRPFDNYELRYRYRLRSTQLGGSVPRRFLYGALSQTELILVALCAHALREREASPVLDALDIRSVTDVSLRLKPPDRYDSDIHDPWSMGLEGALKEFVAELGYAVEGEEDSSGAGENIRKTYRFSNPGLEKLAAFAMRRETTLFNILLECQNEGLMDSFSCQLEMRNGAQIGVDDLSEGEKQLAIVMGTIRLSRHEESLYLLDEPDTHLNPAWSVKYLETLHQVTNADKDHVLLATHDPLVVSGLHRSQVRVLKRDDETGRIVVEEPDFDPVGMGVSALLKSELYGLRSDLDPGTLGKLDARARLYAKGDGCTPDERAELVRLSGELASLGFAREFRDPLFQQFTSAMARRQEGRTSQILTDDEIENIEKIADSVLDEILKDPEA